MEHLTALHGLDVELVGDLKTGKDDLDIAALWLSSEQPGLRFALDIYPGPSSAVEVIHAVT